MDIGKVRVEPPLVLAPMAGVSDAPFRQLAKEAGCGLVFTEMVSDRGLLQESAASREILRFEEKERPLGVQLFGSDPALLARAAVEAVRLGADLIDINMGCPVPKVVKTGAGAALMRHPELAASLVAAVRSAVDCPVTVKMRKSWDEEGPDAVELAGRIVAAGASGVTVHGRTRAQFYSGRADWDIITRVKAAVAVPVVGNGDVFHPEDAARMLEATGCDGVMIARGALGNPWIFLRAAHYLCTGHLLPPPTPKERVEMACRHLELMLRWKGPRRGLVQMRKHAGWYLKGCPGAAGARDRLVRAESPQELVAALGEWLECVTR
ncbi:MAG TPA: tRNA dihydrouridine synthase DusB [Clostridiales bacterium UBA8153]|nr:tRNA dihydrouridine synthase DusB [Clostridiales bacterium UBA8153]